MGPLLSSGAQVSKICFDRSSICSSLMSATLNAPSHFIPVAVNSSPHTGQSITGSWISP